MIILVLPVWPTMPYLPLVTLLRLETLHTRPTTSHHLLRPLSSSLAMPSLTMLWMQGSVADVSFLDLSYSLPILPNSISVLILPNFTFFSQVPEVCTWGRSCWLQPLPWGHPAFRGGRPRWSCRLPAAWPTLRGWEACWGQGQGGGCGQGDDPARQADQGFLRASGVPGAYICLFSLPLHELIYLLLFLLLIFSIFPGARWCRWGY